MPNDAITPFILAVPQADLEDLNRRIDQTRWPDAGDRYHSLRTLRNRRLLFPNPIVEECPVTLSQRRAGPHFPYGTCPRFGTLTWRQPSAAFVRQSSRNKG
jgi:hypothetical protein